MKNTILQLKALVLVIMSLFCVNLVMAQSDFKWELMGPDNVGGAVKAVLYDKADKNGFTMYAGATNGGFLKGLTTKHGISWSRVDFNVNGEPVSLNVSYMLQADDNTIYIGTGSKEDSLRGYPVFGKGIYSYKDGVGTLVAGTKPALGSSEDWKFINAMQINGNQLWAATNTGLFYQGANGWENAKFADGTDVKGNVTEVKLTGSRVLMYLDDKFYIGTIAGNDFTLNEVISKKVDNSPLNKNYPGPGFMKFAVGNNDNNTVYAMRVYPFLTKKGNAKGLKSVYYAFYMSVDGGATWNNIINGNSVTFLPYFASVDKSGDNWTMSTTGDCVFSVMVNPNDKSSDGTLFFGYNKLGMGVKYTSENSADYVFNWSGAVSQGGNMLVQTPYYLHESIYSLVLNPYKAGEFLVGNAGGISLGKITSSQNSLSGATFNTINRGIDVTDFNVVSFTSDGSVLGGTLNNGLQYFDKSENIGKASKEFFGYYTNSGTYSLGSFQMSSMFDNVMFVKRIQESTGVPAIMRTETKGADYALQSIFYQVPSGPPMLPTTINLWESVEDYGSIDSIDFVTVINYKKGDNIWVESNSQKFPILHTFDENVAIGETVRVQDIVTSKAFFTFSGDVNEFSIFMVRGVNNFKLTPLPVKLAGFKQIDQRYVGMAGRAVLSTNGNSYYVITTKGFLIRLSNLGYVYDEHTAISVATTELLDISKDFDVDTYGKYGKDVYVTSMSIDPSKEERIIITFNKPIKFTNATGVSNIFICENTFSDNPEFKAVYGLEKYSILSSIIEAKDGVSSNNRVLVGTTLGLLCAENIGSSEWINIGGEIGNVPITDIKQQLMKRDKISYLSGSPISPKPQEWPAIKNTYDLYISTYGRGIYTMLSTKGALGINDFDASNFIDKEINIYPNPVDNKFCVEIENMEDVIKVNLVDMSGKSIHISNFSCVENGKIRVDGIGNLPKGIYMLQVITSNRMYSGKIIKK